MRCKICGAKLKREGDICKNCYQEYKQKEKLYAEDEEVLLRIKRKYSPKYNLLRSGELIAIAILASLAAFSKYNVLSGILVTLLCIIGFGVWMFFCKKRASGTQTIFYETKLRYKANYPFAKHEEVIPYDTIKDMSYFQTRSQKICKVGDIRFYTQGFLSGLTIHDIPEITENFKKIQDIINSSR